LVLACALALVSIAQGALPGLSRVPVRIEPSSTWVGIAKVHLSLSDLWLAGPELEGRYSIRVPLQPSQDDYGTIRLTTPISLDQLRTAGGTLLGTAHSAFHDRVHDVACRVESDGSIRITVTTDQRTLNFASRFVMPPQS
jgi:hypothetical protein